jgi:amino acid transporter
MAARALGTLRKKPIEQIGDEAGGGLQRSLGLWQLTAIGVGGIASAAAAFSYAELAGSFPRAGAASTFGYAVLGELGWGIGWDLLLEHTAIVAVAAIGILTVMLAFTLGGTRPWSATTDATRHVPVRVTWVAGVLSAVIAGPLPIAGAAELTDIGFCLWLGLALYVVFSRHHSVLAGEEREAAQR